MAIAAMASAQQDFYVVNQGNYYDNITGTLSSYDGQSLTNDALIIGDTPENAVLLNDHLYVPCNASSNLTVINTRTMTVEARIPLVSPQYACTDGVHIYVTESDGNLARINPTTNDVTRTFVGNSPYACAYANGKVYVNCGPWDAGYTMPVGRAVMVVDAESFTKTNEITVGLNPYDQIAVDGEGYVYTVCSGDFVSVMPEVWQISPDETAQKYADGSIIAIDTKSNALYIINSTTDYSNYPDVTVKNTYTTINTVTNDTQVFTLTGESEPASPIAAFVNPLNGHLYVTSDGTAGNYSSLGTIHEYSTDGELQNTFVTGVHPYCIVFSDSTDGISNISQSTHNNISYGIDGRINRLSYPGLILRNGEKTLLRR